MYVNKGGTADIRPLQKCKGLFFAKACDRAKRMRLARRSEPPEKKEGYRILAGGDYE